ncbi:membrane protein [Geothrix oryzae]|jgi:regulator of protease activity HflC (stomatin/prohibitin superfamily)|uniref:Membrane protein n=1 Tax=Geothrix oryzae TaxID=2927975 RepID=A0ABN6UW84_9BACT|nr:MULTISPECIES: slipin family protein [Geothrix]BDU68888.1 membrane protein [Geothrix oryzae]
MDALLTTFGCFGPAAIFVLIYLLSCLKVVNEYERLVIFTLGKVQEKPKGPGLCFVWRPFQTAVTVSLRTVVMDVPSQDIITRDNVSLKVSAVVYFKVLDPKAAIIGVENYYYATSQMAQTTLRSILGEVTLDELLADREKLSQRLREIIDRSTEPWGIEVTSVELKSVDLPEQIQRAMGKQAEAEREKRAKIIAAEGELMASQQLLEAANKISENPTAIQMRYLQTLAEIATEKNSTIVFPLPIEFMRAFEKLSGK